jgi:hypothetical protein
MLGGDQTITISAAAPLRASAADAFAFLAQSCNHQRLQVTGLRLLSLHDRRAEALSGGTIALDGPLGFRRIAHTRVSLCQPPYRLAGSARLDSGTEAHVSWTLRAVSDHAVQAELTAVLGPVARADRIALAIGGRHWVRGLFMRTLRRLGAEVERAPAATRAASGTPARWRAAAGPGAAPLA